MRGKCFTRYLRSFTIEVEVSGMTLGENLQTLRKAAGLSQEQVAKTLFVTRQTVSKWENNQAEPGVENLKALARLYGVTLDRLMGVEPSPAKPRESTPEEPADTYFMALLLFAGGTAVCATATMVAYGEISVPFSLLAMIAGFWLRRPEVWWIIQGLLGMEVGFLVLVMLGALPGTVVALFKVLINGSCMWAMCRAPVRRRFCIEE